MHGSTNEGVETTGESLCNLRVSVFPTLRGSGSLRNLRVSVFPTLRGSESIHPHHSHPHPHRSPKSVSSLAFIGERGSNNSIVGVVDDDSARKTSPDNFVGVVDDDPARKYRRVMIHQ